jgi:MFS superfamily sulfate permease-like transporter
VFRIPFPVQPLKALTAVAVAQNVAPDVIHAAGLEIAAFLLLLSVGRTADTVARLFTKPVVRALQLGVGVLLVVTAVRLARQPPEVFGGTPHQPWPVLLAATAFVALWWAARRRRYELALLLLVVGIAAAWMLGAPSFTGPAFSLPSVALPNGPAFVSAFLLLVVPQLPLTFGNAVVAVTDVAHAYFPDSAARLTPTRVCLSCGTGNVFSALVGGMPMCHGAGGLTAHVRLGARTVRMNVVLGSSFVVLGLFFARQIPAILGLLPVWALAGFLAYAGLRHALLAFDLDGGHLALAVVAGATGAWMGNLTVTMAIALLIHHTTRRRGRGHQPSQRL